VRWRVEPAEPIRNLRLHFGITAPERDVLIGKSRRPLSAARALKHCADRGKI
jgi:hypothetical protein